MTTLTIVFAGFVAFVILGYCALVRAMMKPLDNQTLPSAHNEPSVVKYHGPEQASDLLALGAIGLVMIALALVLP